MLQDDGLHLINRLLLQTKTHLSSGGLVILEADPRQHTAIIQTASELGLELLEESGFCLAFAKR